MKSASRISILLLAMVAVAGAYHYAPVRSATALLLAASVEEFAKVPQSFRSLPEELRAAAGQLQAMTVQAKASVAIGIHELEDRL